MSAVAAPEFATWALRSSVARAVTPWTWAKALRDQGPDEWGFLLVMHTLRTYMDRDGFAYPAQSTLASGARMHVKTVRRHLKRAQDLNWIGIESAQRQGKAWRHFAYRCCVPDAVVLDDKDQELTESLTSSVGDVEEAQGGEPIVSPPKRERGDTRTSPPASDVGTSKDATWGHSERRWGHSAPKVGTQLEPTKSASEVSSITHALTEGQRASAPTPLLKYGLQAKSRESDSKQAKADRIRELLSTEEFREASNREVARVMHTTEEEVELCRRAAG